MSETKSWTPRDYETLKQYLRENMHIDDIAYRMGRSAGAIDQAVIRIIRELNKREGNSADIIASQLHIDKRYVLKILNKNAVSNETLHKQMLILEEKMDAILRNMTQLYV